MLLYFYREESLNRRPPTKFIIGRLLVRTQSGPPHIKATIMKLVMNRNLTVSSTSGHAVKFFKDKPVYVPPMLVSECMAKGAIPAEGEKLNVPEAKDKEQVPPPIGDERITLLEQAFEEMVAKNERTAFGANGIPKIDALRKLISFPIDAGELKALWKAYKVKANEATASE